ncbi:MAG: serine--tRNA ligase [Candidatus Odinarchaeia archaeon]
MKFSLNGYISFSGDLKVAEEDIKNFVKNANENILTKGVPKEKFEEGAKIVNWKIDGDKLYLTIESGRYMRAHSAFLRIHKNLASLLGPKYKIGARDLFVNKYVVRIPLENVEAPKAIPKIPRVSDVRVENNEIVVELDNLDEASIRGYEVDRIIKLLQSFALPTLTERVTKIPPGTVVSRSKPKTFKFTGDPTQTALDLGWLEEFPGKGQFFYTPPITKLFRAIERIFIEEVSNKLGFQECMFPKMIPLEVMDRMRYLEGICEGMFYICAPERNPELFEDLKTELFVTRKIPYKKLREGLKDPGYALSAAQCEPFYQYLAGKTFKESEMPIKYMDHSGYTFRYEAGGARGLERAFEFQRIELVWAGTPEQVEKIRDQTLKEAERVAEDILELDWWTEVGDDPFYLIGRFTEDREIELPDVPKYELRVTLPYKSTESEKASIATSSFNVHGQHYVKGFSAKLDTGKTLWTGCTGLGTTRWLVGFLAQHGFNPDDWPKRVRELAEPLPEVRKLTV